jgi:Mn-dependent DtxR family transcriptional regulator
MAGNNCSAPQPRSIRLTGENLERLAYAEKLGISQSTVVNTLLKLHLRDFLLKVRKEKIEEIRESLNAPVP